MASNIDKDMLDKLNGPGRSGQRYQLPGNTAGTYTHERSRPLNQSEQNPSNKMRISNLVDRKTSLPVTQDAADQRATQIRDIQNRPQQLTPSASSHGNRTPVSPVTSRTTHAGSESTTSRKHLELPSLPATKPPVTSRHSSSHHPTQSTLQITQRTPNDRPAPSQPSQRRSASSVPSQKSPVTILPRGGALPGPSTAPPQNVASHTDTTHPRTQVPDVVPQQQETRSRCKWCGLLIELSYDRLGRHERQSKKLRCDVGKCSQKICSKSSLEKHQRVVHKVIKYYCSDCVNKGKYVGFEKQDDLTEHRKTHNTSK